MAIESVLDWLVSKITSIKQRSYLREYAERVHQGPIPVNWRIREGIPPHEQWPRDNGSLTGNIVVGKVKFGPVKPVRAPAFPTGGNRNWKKYPLVICLCGSTRFYDAFQQANYDLTMQGKIVLSVGFYPHATSEAGHGEGVGHDSVEKIALDELHKRKIDLADEVLVLNVGGYIGDSTRSEIEYAKKEGKIVRYLEVEESA